MLRAGFVWIPLNARAAPPELIHVINLTECEIVLYDAEFESAVEGLKASCAGVRSFLCIKDPSDSFGTQLSPYHGHLYPELTERSEEHTSELQSLMRISSAVFCLNKQTTLF